LARLGCWPASARSPSQLGPSSRRSNHGVGWRGPWLVGGITGARRGMGIPEYEAKRYEGRVKDAVSCSPAFDNSEWNQAGQGNLEHTGAQDVPRGEASAISRRPT